MRKVLLVFLALLALAANVRAQNWDPDALDLTYSEAFAMINSELAWPCQHAQRGNISSAFGPRVYSTGRDDFHRGLDIYAFQTNTDEDLYAVYDGVVHQKTTWSGGGHILIIKHHFTDPATGLQHTARLHEDSLRTEKWYSLYLHMRDVDRPEAGETVTAGQYIGKMGDTGKAGDVHLHLEIRLGTTCSLQYAIENEPHQTCNLMDYDPHINPMLILPILTEQEHQRPKIDQTCELSPNTDGEFLVRYNDDNPNGNRIKFEQVAQDGTVRVEHVLDFNTREGYDASSTTMLDTWEKEMPWFRPMPRLEHPDYVLGHFVVPSKFVCKKYVGDRFRITFDSAWGTEETRWVFWFGELPDEWDTSDVNEMFCSIA